MEAENKNVDSLIISVNERMLETLIPSQTRIKLLIRLFLNPGTTAYLRGLSKELGENTNSIRIELNRLKDAGLLLANVVQNKKVYQVNINHPLFEDIHNILLKYIGIHIIKDVVFLHLGSLKQVFLTGDYAAGKIANIVDLIFIGDVDSNSLSALISQAESLINKKIRHITFSANEWKQQIAGFKEDQNLLLWTAE